MGKLSQDDISSNTVGKNTKEVGKLAIDNSQNELIEVLEGGTPWRQEVQDLFQAWWSQDILYR